MKKVRWIAGERKLCGFGSIKTGETRLFPDDVADGFIMQGMAELANKTTSKKTKEATK